MNILYLFLFVYKVISSILKFLLWSAYSKPRLFLGTLGITILWIALIKQRLTKSPLNQLVHVTQNVVDEVKELYVPEMPIMVENGLACRYLAITIRNMDQIDQNLRKKISESLNSLDIHINEATKIYSDFRHEAIVFSRTVLDRMNAIEEQLSKDDKSEKANENIQKHLDAIKKRIPALKVALTKAIKKTYEVTATAKDAHLVLDDGKTSAIRHENSLYQRLLHFINSEDERILIKDHLEEIDEVITSIKDLQNNLEFFDKIIDDYRIKSQEIEVQLEENINHEEIDKNSLRDLKYITKKLTMIRIWSTKRAVNSLVFVFSDETSQVIGTPNKGRLTDFLWVDGEYITELSYIMGKYINGIEIKTNSGRSTGWQGSRSGRKERIVPGFFSNWFSCWRGLYGTFSEGICSIMPLS
ncbi:11658_t:CDS:2, partial [Gigaspora rosea]